jgi:hypothetical protein
MEFDRTAALILTPIFLALMMMKLRRDAAERRLANTMENER